MYVGKIAPGVDDPTIQALLEACGPVKSWNRLVVSVPLTLYRSLDSNPKHAAGPGHPRPNTCAAACALAHAPPGAQYRLVMTSWLMSVLTLQDSETQQPKGFGFVEYEDAEGVMRALQHLNNLALDGQELMLKPNTTTQVCLRQQRMHCLLPWLLIDMAWVCNNQ